MIFSGHRKIIEMLYTDSFDVYKFTQVTNADGSTDTILDTTPTIANQKCRISFPSMENPKDMKVDETPIRAVPKLFCAPDLDIQEGDIIVLRRLGEGGRVLKTYEGQVGLPSVYPSHLEFLFFERKPA